MSARRDPEGRRRRIVTAACELIAEVGIGRLTHRLVAARAGVPLGATTYYFRSLDELVAAALEHATAISDDILRAWTEAIEAGSKEELPDTLARLTEEYCADRSRVTLDTELYVGAGRHAELRPLACSWVDGLTAALTPHTGEARARAMAALIDGVLLHSFILDEPIDVAALREALAALARPADDRD